MATPTAHGRTDAADNLMLTGTVLVCPDCGDDRIFVVPDCGDGLGDCGDYCCTDCGAAVSVDLVVYLPGGRVPSRVA
jgi:DNA-directed RNA polymerase subunit RPC12/RpoP